LIIVDWWFLVIIIYLIWNSEYFTVISKVVIKSTIDLSTFFQEENYENNLRWLIKKKIVFSARRTYLLLFRTQPSSLVCSLHVNLFGLMPLDPFTTRTCQDDLVRLQNWRYNHMRAYNRTLTRFPIKPYNWLIVDIQEPTRLREFSLWLFFKRRREYFICLCLIYILRL